jgi:hypothetical protein
LFKWLRSKERPRTRKGPDAALRQAQYNIAQLAVSISS